MKTIKIYVCGKVIDATSQENITERYEKWFGQGSVQFGMTSIDNEVTLTFARDYGINIGGSLLSDSIFAGDWQLWFGDSWECLYPTQNLLPSIARDIRMLFYEEPQAILKRYRTKAKAVGATRPKSLELVKEDNKEFIIKLTY